VTRIFELISGLKVTLQKVIFLVYLKKKIGVIVNINDDFFMAAFRFFTLLY